MAAGRAVDEAGAGAGLGAVSALVWVKQGLHPWKPC